MSNRTKLVWLTNLHNPTHCEIEPELLTELVSIANKAGATVVVDEVYLPFVRFDFRGHGFTYGAVSVNGLDKAFGLDGLRVGWAIASRETVERAYKLNNLMGVNQPYPTEEIGYQILRNDRALDWFRVRIQNANAGAQFLHQFLKSTPLVTGISSSGGVNACIKLPDKTDDMEFAASLKTEKGVSVFPGSLFELPGHIRVSFGGDAVVMKQSFGKLRELIMERYS